MVADPHELQRFLDAQDRDGIYERALDELRAGRKSGHWIWFVFPQLRGLGHSSMAHRYGIASLAEARAYLDHVVLGPRLRECASALLENEGRSAEEVLGEVDAVKLRSSMTLFARAAGEGSVFQQVLDLYFDGTVDELTEQRL